MAAQLKLVHALANLCDTRRGDNDQPSAKMSLAVTGTDPARTRAVLERAVDSSFSESYHDVLVKAYALYSVRTSICHAHALREKLTNAFASTS